MFKQPFAPSNDSDSDSDDISLTSTVASDVAEDQVYLVENVLARKSKEDGEWVYLVKWEGYPIERCSWEPIDMFDDPHMVDDWRPDSKPFDWKKWDADRAREEEEKEDRRWRRHEKRKKPGLIKSPPASPRKARKLKIEKEREKESIKRGSRASSANLSAFVISDDEEDLLNEGTDDGDDDDDDEDEDDELPILRRRRLRQRKTRKSAREEIDDLADDSNKSDSSSGSMMEDLRRKNVRKKKKPLPLERKTEPQLPAPKLQEPKKRLRSISPVRQQPAPSKPSKVVQQKSTQKAQHIPQQQPAQPVKKSNYGTARRTKPPAKPGQVEQQQLYNKLSIQHRAFKRSTKERTPDVNQVSLFRPGDIPVRTRPAPLWISSLDLGSTDTAPLKGPLLAIRTSPPPKRVAIKDIRKSSAPVPSATARLSGPSTPIEGPPGYSPRLSQVSFSLPPDAPRPVSIPAMPVEPAEVLTSASIPTGPVSLAPFEYFETMVEYGPSNDKVQTIESLVRFTGFTPGFLSMVAGGRAVPRIRISHSLENAYLVKYFVPEMGPPLEFADLEVDGEKCGPLVDALAILHGAGVVLHTSFTLLIFQPSNDTLRNAFKTPQQRRRTALRTVAYPPLKIRRPQTDTAVLRPAYDEGFTQYLPNLLYRTMGLNLAEIFSGAGKKCACYIYCHDVASAERIELESALQMMGIPLMKVEELRKRAAEWKKYRINNYVFVHYSLQDKLHLLPGIGILQAAQSVQFHFFGYVYDTVNTSLTTRPTSQFWKFGTYILLAPSFVIKSTTLGAKFIGMIEHYQQQKSGSTGILIPSTLVDCVQTYLINNSTHPHRQLLEDNLRIVYSLTERAKRKVADEFCETFGVRILEIDVPTSEEEEFELVVDRLVFFQKENLDIRKFTMCHMEEKAKVRPLMEIYGSVEFLDADGIMRRYQAPTEVGKKDKEREKEKEKTKFAA